MVLALYLAVCAVILTALSRLARVSFVACLTLTFLPLIPTARAVFTERIFGPVDVAFSQEPLRSMAGEVGIRFISNPSLSDASAQALPWYVAARRAVLAHEWPLWNPFEFCGNVLLAAVQSGPFHPIHLLSYALPLPDAITFNAVATLFLAVLSMFLLLRDLVETETAAIAGAVAWMFSAHLMFFLDTALGLAFAGLPLLLLAAGRVARDPSFRTSMQLIAALTLLVSAGHSEAMLHEVALATVWFAWIALGDRSQLPRAAFHGLGAGVVTLLLCAILVVPHIEALTQTDEFQARDIKVASHAASTLTSMTHQLLAQVLPFIDGQPGLYVPRHAAESAHFAYGYADVGTLMLAAAAFAIGAFSRRREVRFFAGVALFSLLVGIGAPGISNLLNHLPLFSLSVNGRMVSFAALAICVLGAIAIDSLDRPSPRLALSFFSTAAIIAAALVAMNRDLLASGLPQGFLRIGALRAIVPLVVGGVGVAYLRPRYAAAALIALLLIQRGGETAGTRPVIARAALAPAFPGLELITAPHPPARVIGVDNMLMPNIATLYGLEDARGYQAMTFARYREVERAWSVPQPVWSNRVDALGSPFLSLMNVRWAIAPPDVAVPPQWRVRFRGTAYWIVENLGALPRAFIPSAVHLGAGGGDTHAIATCPDFAAEAWIETKDARRDETNGQGRVEIGRLGSNRFAINADLQSDAWVVTSESAWKGWHATADGHRIPIRVADGLFMACRLPAGKHHVLLEYRPASFVVSEWVSALTALAICGALAAAAWRRRAAMRVPIWLWRGQSNLRSTD